MQNSTLRRVVETCTGHRLMDYDGKCANLHGHNYRWEVNVDTALVNPTFGIALDFGDMKRVSNALLDLFDHTTVLREDDPLVDILLAQKQKLVVLNVNPTAENLSAFVAHELTIAFNAPVSVNLWETSSCSAFSMGDGRKPLVEIRKERV